jgi:hypothetical protein
MRLLGLLPFVLAAAALLSGGVALVLRLRGPWTPREQWLATASLVLAGSTVVVSLATTVVSLVRAFDAVAMVNPADKATILANGISEAMNRFAYGLVLSVPAGFIAILTVVAVGKRKPHAPPQGR